MKKTIYLFIGTIGIFVLFTSEIYFSGGSPGAKTGSPGDEGLTCTGCHAGTVNSASGWITSDIPATGYMPGETYTITATGTHTGVVKFGFEVTAEDNTDAKTGTFVITNTTETKLINSDAAVTHSPSGTIPNGNMKTWSFDWTAPAEGTGDVTFYGAFNATNGDGETSGDVVYNTNYSAMEHVVGVNEIQNEDIAVNVYPNPFTDYVTVTSQNDEKQIAKVQVFNQAGSLLRQVNTVSVSGKWKIETNDLNTGMYFVVVENTDNTTVSKSIIKL